MSLWKPLADQGNALAQGNLGFMYFKGPGVPKDDAQAVKWCRLAVDQGDARAQTGPGFMYADGADVPREYVLAYMWLNLGAAGGGNVWGEKNRDTVLAPRMTPADISEAQWLSRERKSK